MKERIVFLDYLKTLTIIMVIIYHGHAYEAMVMPIFLSVCVVFFLVVNGNLMLMKLNALTSTVI